MRHAAVRFTLVAQGPAACTPGIPPSGGQGLIVVRQNRSLFARLAAAVTMLLAVVTLAAVALHGWQMHLLSLDSQRRAVGVVANLGAAHLTSAVDTRPADASARDALISEFEHWGWAALQQPRVLAIALGDSQGQVLASLPTDARTAELVARLPSQGAETGLAAANLFDRSTRKVWIAARPVGDLGGTAPLAILVVVAGRPPLTGAWVSWTLIFGVPLGGVASLSFVIALRWLRRRVQEPLDTLIRRGAEDTSAWLARLPTDRSDELGRIARETGDLLAELRDLHGQLGRLRRSLDSRVVARTRQMNAKLRDARRKAWIDPLTGLGNRRLLEERLEELFDLQRDTGAELTVVMFDIDNFKNLNDTLGHAAGDELLRFLGELLQSSLRETDVAVRYAGDEFLVLLPEVSPDLAAGLADRILRLFAQHTSLLETQPQPTLSAGVASTCRSQVANGKRLIDLADAALYKAKSHGKNTVYVVGRPNAPQPQETARPARQT